MDVSRWSKGGVGKKPPFPVDEWNETERRLRAQPSQRLLIESRTRVVQVPRARPRDAVRPAPAVVGFERARPPRSLARIVCGGVARPRPRARRVLFLSSPSMPSTVRRLLAGRICSVLAGPCQFGTAWAGLRLIHHHHSSLLSLSDGAARRCSRRRAPSAGTDTSTVRAASRSVAADQIDRFRALRLAVGYL